MLIKRKYLFGTTILAGIMAVAAPAFAQNQLPGVTVQGQSAQDATEIEEVVVTGSRIRRDPTTSPTPLTQVSREDLLTTGQSTVIDYLATIPALANSQVPSDTTGSLNAMGLSLPNLRSLGAGRTLTLVDGRRHVGSGIGSLSVDVDTIPRLLIENIEIVTGGASSVYGADAVSGVLNFVLRKDFEGLEIDGQYNEINQDGQAGQRLSILAGANFLDDRLNVYAFGEYDRTDRLTTLDFDWAREGWLLLGNDGDPAVGSPNGPNIDGVPDNLLWDNIRQLSIVRWGQLTLANNYPGSPLNDPDRPANTACSNVYSSGCYNIAEGSTYIFENGVPRLANFGEQVQITGQNRAFHRGGDGESYALYNLDERSPEMESKRFQVGLNFALTPNINIRAEAKYVTEENEAFGGRGFADVYISDLDDPNLPMPILSARTSGASQFSMRVDDSAYLPASLRTAIYANTIQQYSAPTLTQPGQPIGGLVSRPFARYTAWTIDRYQENTRDLQRYVLSADGTFGDIGPLRNIGWDIGYTYGQVDNLNLEYAYDTERFAYAIDAVVDTAGVVNGRANEIVCRVQLLTATAGSTIPNENPLDPNTTYNKNSPNVRDCRPLNIFGEGQQDPAAIDYVRAVVTVDETNRQHQAVAAFTAQTFDIFGAGPVGIALGAEWRKEESEGIGRGRSVGTRWLLANTGDDWTPASYESREIFGEVSVPLFRDHWLGRYAELSGSYRISDYTTFGRDDVYGVNLVYRPNTQLAFKTSFNTSQRIPNLTESNGPRIQTFASIADPCDAQTIQNMADRTIAGYRAANCAALQAQINATLAPADQLNFQFTDGSAANAYRPVYSSSVAGALAGNPDLKPETSESFTFSTVFQPDFIPGYSLTLDYYDIVINNVLASITGPNAANLCVSGETLNTQFCNAITRSPVDIASAPNDDRFKIVDFRQSSYNFAKRTTRGVDITSRYGFDLEEFTGHNLGRLDWSVRGTWLIELKQFNDIANPYVYTTQDGTPFYPRLRLSSSLTYTPNDTWSFNWTMDWQTAQDLIQRRAQIANIDNRDTRYYDTGNFARHDLSVRWNVRDDVSLRAGVTNVFDAEPAKWLDVTSFYNNFDPFGRRFFIGFNYHPQ